jgi:hypothetical protein
MQAQASWIAQFLSRCGFIFDVCIILVLIVYFCVMRGRWPAPLGEISASGRPVVAKLPVPVAARQPMVEKARGRMFDRVQTADPDIISGHGAAPHSP